MRCPVDPLLVLCLVARMGEEPAGLDAAFAAASRACSAIRICSMRLSSSVSDVSTSERARPIEENMDDRTEGGLLPPFTLVVGGEPDEGVTAAEDVLRWEEGCTARGGDAAEAEAAEAGAAAPPTMGRGSERCCFGEVDVATARAVARSALLRRRGADFTSELGGRRGLETEGGLAAAVEGAAPALEAAAGLFTALFPSSPPSASSRMSLPTLGEPPVAKGASMGT